MKHKRIEAGAIPVTTRETETMKAAQAVFKSEREHLANGGAVEIVLESKDSANGTRTRFAKIGKREGLPLSIYLNKTKDRLYLKAAGKPGSTVEPSAA